MIRGSVAVLAFLLGSALLLVVAAHAPPSPAELPVEPAVPQAAAVTAGQASALVMAFIETSGDDPSGTNRGQALAIRSMREQYERRGIRVLVVQAFSGPDADAHRNVRHDWGLDGLTILPDPGGRLARAYAVEEFPTTLVFDDLGGTLAVWRGYSPPASMGPVLERIATARGGQG